MEYYEIVVESHVDRKRLKDFHGLSCEHLPEGRTLLAGDLKDQAELFAILSKIRDMNLTLLSFHKDKKGESSI